MTDILSDVLRHVRLTGAVFLDVDATSPWVAEAPAAHTLAPFVLPGAEHILEFHAMLVGRCYGGLIDEQAIELEAGDIIMFPQGDPHVMSSAPGMRGPSGETAIPRATRLPIAMHEGPAGPRDARVICGFISCDLRPFNPVIAALPRVMVSKAKDPPRSQIIEEFMKYAAVEARDSRIGSHLMLTKLSELVFIEMVRRYVECLPEHRVGWLAGMRDPHVGRALAEIHEHPSEAFTLESLARTAGLSRSALAERFMAMVGLAPIQYLARWRMQLASSLLGRGDLTLGAIAAQVGYESEAAFSRAFKKAVGTSPGQWRRNVRGEG